MMSKPVLILMAGHQGVGKSTIACELAKMHNLCLLDIDDFRDTIYLHSCSCDDDSKGRLAYKLLNQMAFKQLALKNSVIVDTPLTHDWLREELFSTAHTLKNDVFVIYCFCSEELAISRNQTRYNADPQKYARRDIKAYERLKNLYSPIDKIASLRIDTGKSLENNVDIITDQLNKCWGNPASIT